MGLCIITNVRRLTHGAVQSKNRLRVPCQGTQRKIVFSQIIYILILFRQAAFVC